MRFSRAKLPVESLRSLRRIAVELFRPFMLMVAPVYIHLRLNLKLVAVKGPLQFFSPEELEKLKGYHELYLPDFVEDVVPFQRAGEAVRRLFGATEVLKVASTEGVAEVPVPAAPSEVGDAVIRIIGPLWGEGGRIEPFFLTFLADEICGAVPAKRLEEAAATDVLALELGLLRAGCAVFLALHLSMLDGELLRSLRDAVLEETLGGAARSCAPRTEVEQVARLAALLVPDPEAREVTFEAACAPGGRIGAKLKARFERIGREFVKAGAAPATIFGERGFRDVA